jgi:hypothetical protein
VGFEVGREGASLDAISGRRNALGVDFSFETAAAIFAKEGLGISDDRCAAAMLFYWRARRDSLNRNMQR